MAKKKQEIKSTSEVVSEISALKFQAAMFAQKPEVSEKIITLMGRAIDLMRLEAVIRRDFAEINFMDEESWVYFLDRREAFVKDFAQLQADIREFLKATGLSYS